MLSNVQEALSVAARADDIEVRCEAASVLNALSINDDNKLDLAKNDVMLLILVDLLKVDDPRCLRQVMGCIANLSERIECHTYLRRHSFHTSVVEYFHHNDIALVREATRFITNLSSVHENHPSICGGGGIPGLMTAIFKEDAMTTRFAALGLMNLTTLQDNHNDLIFGKAYAALIFLAAGAKRKWFTLDALGELMEEQEPASPRTKNDWSFVTKYGYDKEARRYAALALGNLAINTASHTYLMPLVLA
jgi:hypothetical protein